MDGTKASGKAQKATLHDPQSGRSFELPILSGTMGPDIIDISYAEDSRRPDPALPLHEHCLFKLGVPLGELWYLTELATSGHRPLFEQPDEFIGYMNHTVLARTGS